VKASPHLAANRIIGEAKGYTSRLMRQQFPELRGKRPYFLDKDLFGFVNNR
jgi:REP element-mobilizing transposase RayT